MTAVKRELQSFEDRRGWRGWSRRMISLSFRL